MKKFIIVLITLLCGFTYADEFKITKPFIQKGHSSSVTALAVTPDGKYFVSGGADNTVKMWDKASGTLIHTFTGLNQSLEQVDISSDGKLVSGSSLLNDDILWNTNTKKTVVTGKGMVGAVGAISADGRHYAMAKNDNIYIINTATLKAEKQFNAESWVKSIRYVDNTSFVYSLSDSLIYSDNNSDVIKKAIAKKDMKITDVSGNIVTACNMDGDIMVWNLKSGESEFIRTDDQMLYGAALAADKKSVISAGTKGAAIWDIATGAKKSVIYDKPAFSVTTVKNSGELLVGAFGSIKLMTDTGNIIKSYGENAPSIISMQEIPSNRTFVSGTNNGELIFRSQRDGAITNIINVFEESSPVKVSVSSKYIAAISGKIIKILDLNNLKMISRFAYLSTAMFATFSEDGRYLAVSGGLKTSPVLVYETESGSIVHSIDVPDMLIRDVRYSSDGKLLAVPKSTFTAHPTGHAGPYSWIIYCLTP